MNKKILKNNLKIVYKIGIFFLKCLTFLTPFIWATAIATSLVDVFFYPGAFLKHTGFNPFIVYLIMGTSCTLIMFYPNYKKSTFIKFFFKLNYLFIFVFGFALILFTILNLIKHANYVFSTFHIHAKELNTPILLLIFTYITSLGELLVIGKKKLKRFVKTKLLIQAVLILVLIQNLTTIWNAHGSDFKFMFGNPILTVDKKIEHKLGETFFKFVVFIKENTPEDAKILLPPFPAYPWPQTGNMPYMRYFLYPRTLTSGNEYEPGHDLISEGFDYVLIAWGETWTTSGVYTHGWPKFDVRAERLIFMLPNGDKRIDNNDYIYKNHMAENTWGIIEIKK